MFKRGISRNIVGDMHQQLEFWIKQSSTLKLLGSRSQIGAIMAEVSTQADSRPVQSATVFLKRKYRLSVLDVEHGSYIDGELISILFDAHPSTTKDKNQRPACGCVESVDMGMYNSCPFLCSYCYTNSNSGVIENKLLKQFRDSPTLLGRYEDEQIEIRTGPRKNPNKGGQQSLF